MPLKIIRNDLTQMKVDAIVNPTNENLDGSGGLDRSIHQNAGEKLSNECTKIDRLDVGEVKVTDSYKLPTKYIFHTVGPIWRGGDNNEKEQLESCYTEIFRKASELQLESIAIPIISSGTFGYPKDQALEIARNKIEEFLLENEMEVYLVVYDEETFQISKKTFSDVKDYITQHYVFYQNLDLRRTMVEEPEHSYRAAELESLPSFNTDLEEKLDKKKDSFSMMLLRLIDEKDLDDVTVYKKANIDRRLFSKIRSNEQYTPSKSTAISFAIALELDLEETNELLLSVGYALSKSSQFDIIIEYFIENQLYSIFEINEALFAFTQKTLSV